MSSSRIEGCSTHYFGSGEQFKHGEVTEDEFNRIERFVLMERWARIVDIVLVVTVSPDEALAREHRPRISRLTGSVMNKAVLQSFNDAIEEAVPAYRPDFRLIKTYDTTGAEAKDTNISIAHDVLDNLEKFLNPKIMVVSRMFVEQIVSQDSDGFIGDKDQSVLSEILRNAEFVERSLAEESSDFVQIIACALLSRQNGIFVFERKSKDPKAELYGKNSIWQGAHVPWRDETPEKVITNAIFTKLKNKLFLSREFGLRYLGYAWNRNNLHSSKHLGLLYELSIDSDSVAADLRSKEFRSGRGHGLSGRFLSVADVKAKSEELQLEPWSAAALRAGVGGA
jgi:predicted NUDIX family phosphoesterase